MDLTSLLHVAIKSAIEAGEEVMRIYNQDKIDINIKQDNTPLTNADLAANEIICSHLSSTEIPILSEEGKHLPYEQRKHWKHLWIIDPIDGTKEFIKKNGEFTVNIALIEGQTPILGVILTPAKDELHFSHKEIGSFKVQLKKENDIKMLIKTAVKLPLDPDPTEKKFTVVASRSHLSTETKNYIQKLKERHGELDLISKGSSLKLCMIAEGRANCYPRFAPTMEWDTAAGHAICLHAGFDIIDYKTKKSMLYNRPKLQNNWFIVK